MQLPLMERVRLAWRKNLNSIIVRPIKTIKGIHTEKLQDQKYEELCKFEEAYTFGSPELFADARYKKNLSTSMNVAQQTR